MLQLVVLIGLYRSSSLRGNLDILSYSLWKVFNRFHKKIIAFCILGTFKVKAGLAQMAKGGIIMDVTNAEEARIAENAGVS